MKEINLCTAYRLPDGSTTEDYPVDTRTMAQAEAIYETMPGWDETINAARRFEDLPPTAQAYCQRISQLLDTPIQMISVGAERNDLIVLRWPI